MTSEFSSGIYEGAGESGGGGVSRPLNIKRILVLRTPLAIAVTLLMAIPASIAVWFLTPVRYTADAEIHFLSRAPYVIYRDGKADMSASYTTFVNTQIALMTGNAILSRVLDDPTIRELPEILQAPDPLELLKSRVEARNKGGSELVVVSCTMADKEAAEQILDRIISLYLEYALGQESTEGEERLQLLAKERDTRQMELDLQTTQITSMESELGVAPDSTALPESSEIDLYREGLLRAQEAKSLSDSKIAEFEEQVVQLEALQAQYAAAPAEPVFAFRVEERVGADPRVVTLQRDVVLAEAALADLRERVMEGSYQLKAAQRKLDLLKLSFSEMEKSVRGEVLRSVRAQLMADIDSAKQMAAEAEQRTAKFQQLISDYDSRVQQLTGRLAELQQLRVKATETRRLLQEVRTEMTQITVESKAPARVRLASAPHVPAISGYRRQLMGIALVILASMGFGVGAGLLRELTDQQVRGPQDVARATRYPIIAAIPHAAEDKLPKDIDFHLLTAQYPDSTCADAYRRILSRFLYPEDRTAEVCSLLVTSPTRGDGKTSLACNLAISLAQANRPVLLIDLCNRHPEVERAFGLEEEAGLAEILLGARDPDQVIRATHVDNLAVLGPGLDYERVAGRLASPEMTTFLEAAEKQFFHVILDAPPALLMADAKLLAPVVDGVVIVLGAGVSTVGMVRRCVQDLDQVGANVLGVALNRLRRMRGGYMRHNLRLYYAYGQGHRGNGRYEPGKEGGAADHEEMVILLPSQPDDDEKEG
jgi:polysaccharide biosynthesis transport protein